MAAKAGNSRTSGKTTKKPPLKKATPKAAPKAAVKGGVAAKKRTTTKAAAASLEKKTTPPSKTTAKAVVKKKAAPKTHTVEKAPKQSARKQPALKKVEKKGKVGKPVENSLVEKKTKTAKGEKIEKMNVQELAKKDSTPALKEASTAQTLLSYGVEPYSVQAGEAYMSDRQRAHFRHLLQLWKKALLQGGDETIHDLKESAEVPADISDQATQEETFALRLRTRDRERKLIKKIDEAIALVDSKDYGFCEECGVEIGIRRLEARPTATLCIDCKTLDEVRERQGR